MDLFNKIIDYGLGAKTSDIHLGVGYQPVIRRDGRMSPIEDFPILTETDVDAMVKRLLDNKQYQKLSQGEEVDLSFTYQDKARFRVNVYKERKGINLALRYIPDQVPSLDDLGMPDILKKLVAYPYGLILVTGPTGSGKSTTLAAMIDHINQTTNQHIITIEDPIEYIHQNKKCLIKQREIGEGEDSRSFPHALRAALREDPDVILVGEMRDRETMALAITAAETGHLVLSSVHTNNTYQAINRIIDVFPAGQQDQIRIQLAQNLVGIIAQRLLPKRGGGRLAGLEILINNSAIKTQIKENKIAAIPNTIKAGQQEGMVLLQDYIQNLAAKGLVDPEVSYRFLESQAAY
jgi:twitching motility protein PilT